AALARTTPAVQARLDRPAGPRPSRDAHLTTSDVDGTPDPMPACCALAQAAVEVIRGARPLGQLVRWLTPGVYDAVGRRAALTTGSQASQTGMRTTIRRVRLCRFGTDAVEATVVVDDGPQVRAVALRMELHRGAWRGVALEIG
ncbi:MAG TPA: Rv3235 family protein, partial [Cellulomonadaceae bacterium]|nr:Rv3235 family protein [Cellulomonadaceae bacterium]